MTLYFHRRRRPWSQREFAEAWNERYPEDPIDVEDEEGEEEDEEIEAHSFKKSPDHEASYDETAGRAVSPTEEPRWEDGEDPYSWLGTGYARHVVDAYVEDQTILPSDGAVIAQASRMIPSDEQIRSIVSKGKLVSDEDARAYMAVNPRCTVMVMAKKEVHKRRLVDEKKGEAYNLLLEASREEARSSVVQDLASYFTQYSRSQMLNWRNPANKPESFDPILVSFLFFNI